jgi:hypothetical protein
VKKYVSVPPSPPRLEGQVQGKAEPKTKEHCEVDEGNDAIVIEDSSDDEDEETLQQRFQILEVQLSWGAEHTGHREAIQPGGQPTSAT